MKTLLLVIGILLGIGGTSLYLWMKPQTDDPYFFLTPKVVDAFQPIKIPIALYEKGAAIDYVFWMTPLPQDKYFYLFPASDLVTRITLDIENKNYAGNQIGRSKIFERDGTPEIIKQTPMFDVELYKINSDLSESIIFKERKLFNTTEKYVNSLFLTMKRDYGYGQFRVKITVLGDFPELKHDELTYVVKIAASALK